jgi:hypothetical protein
LADDIRRKEKLVGCKRIERQSMMRCEFKSLSISLGRAWYMLCRVTRPGVGGRKEIKLNEEVR